MTPLTAFPSRALAGTIRVPGDKSISHRALMLGGLAVGETRIEGMLEGEDVLRTGAAMRALGASVTRTDDGVWIVHGVGLGGLLEPADVLDFGNSGTSTRLLLGILASHPMTAFVTGDASLRKRPMRRVIDPLERVGARFVTRAGGRLPLAVTGSAEPLPIVYRPPVASAQVKSAILLAGLNAPGETTVIEPEPSRDHTEIMLRHFGADLRIEAGKGSERIVTVKGQPELAGRPVAVPGDPSSAAFPVVAALICPDSRLTVTGVGMNPLRTGLFETLTEMGADITTANRRDMNGEPVADLTARQSRLKGVDVPAERAPRMIDEYPILAVAAAFAAGRSVFRGIGELKVKESDRLAAIARGLTACGVTVEAGNDSLVIEGLGGPPAGGAVISTELDHRIAMSFLVMGLGSKAAIAIDDAGPISTSFPGFGDLMTGLGAHLKAQ